MAGCDGNGSNSYSSTDGNSEVEQDQQCNKKVINDYESKPTTRSKIFANTH